MPLSLIGWNNLAAGHYHLQLSPTGIYVVGLSTAVLCISFQLLKWISKSRFASGDIAKALLENLGEGFSEVFATPVCIKEGSIKLERRPVHQLSFDYVIPATLCTVSTDGRLYLSLGGVLALADQATSILIMSVDESHRVGVSVSLSGQLHYEDWDNSVKQMECGRTVRVVSRVTKLGATLGFTSMTVLSEDGAIVLATCKHIKFLNTFFIYDKVLGYLAPLILYTLKHWNRRQHVKNLLKVSVARENTEKHWEMYSSTQCRGIETLSSSSANTLPSLTKLLALSPCDSNEAHVARFGLVDHGGISNVFRSVHGGAIAGALFEAGASFAGSQKAKSMCVEYLSPAKSSCFIEASNCNERAAAGIMTNKAVQSVSLTIRLGGNERSKVVATSCLHF